MIGIAEETKYCVCSLTGRTKIVLFLIIFQNLNIFLFEIKNIFGCLIEQIFQQEPDGRSCVMILSECVFSLMLHRDYFDFQMLEKSIYISKLNI